jgi:hypothetical protein
MRSIAVGAERDEWVLLTRGRVLYLNKRWDGLVHSRQRTSWDSA